MIGAFRVLALGVALIKYSPKEKVSFGDASLVFIALVSEREALPG